MCSLDYYSEQNKLNVESDFVIYYLLYLLFFNFFDRFYPAKAFGEQNLRTMHCSTNYKIIYWLVRKYLMCLVGSIGIVGMNKTYTKNNLLYCTYEIQKHKNNFSVAFPPIAGTWLPLSAISFSCLPIYAPHIVLKFWSRPPRISFITCHPLTLWSPSSSSGLTLLHFIIILSWHRRRLSKGVGIGWVNNNYYNTATKFLPKYCFVIFIWNRIDSSGSTKFVENLFIF